VTYFPHARCKFTVAGDTMESRSVKILICPSAKLPWKIINHKMREREGARAWFDAVLHTGFGGGQSRAVWLGVWEQGPHTIPGTFTISLRSCRKKVCRSNNLILISTVKYKYCQPLLNKYFTPTEPTHLG
jgi:hypothetical protein